MHMSASSLLVPHLHHVMRNGASLMGRQSRGTVGPALWAGSQVCTVLQAWLLAEVATGNVIRLALLPDSPCDVRSFGNPLESFSAFSPVCVGVGLRGLRFPSAGSDGLQHGLVLSEGRGCGSVSEWDSHA